jgi:hypothetical protein
VLAALRAGAGARLKAVPPPPGRPPLRIKKKKKGYKTPYLMRTRRALAAVSDVDADRLAALETPLLCNMSRAASEHGTALSTRAAWRRDAGAAAAQRRRLVVPRNSLLSIARLASKTTHVSLNAGDGTTVFVVEVDCGASSALGIVARVCRRALAPL